MFKRIAKTVKRYGVIAGCFSLTISVMCHIVFHVEFDGFASSRGARPVHGEDEWAFDSLLALAASYSTLRADVNLAEHPESQNNLLLVQAKMNEFVEQNKGSMHKYRLGNAHYLNLAKVLRDMTQILDEPNVNDAVVEESILALVSLGHIALSVESYKTMVEKKFVNGGEVFIDPSMERCMLGASEIERYVDEWVRGRIRYVEESLEPVCVSEFRGRVSEVGVVSGNCDHSICAADMTCFGDLTGVRGYSLLDRPVISRLVWSALPCVYYTAYCDQSISRHMMAIFVDYSVYVDRLSGVLSEWCLQP